MKKNLFVALICILGISSLAFSFPGVWQSSTTSTVDTTKNLCPPLSSGNVRGQAILHGICVSSATAVAASAITVYASSATTDNPIALVNTVNTGCFYYDVYSSTSPGGLTYSNTGGGGSIQILYTCY